MQPDVFLQELANHYAEGFGYSNHIRTFATNSDVLGKCAEAAARSFVKRCVYPLHVSTGAVISPEICIDPKTVPQIDTIIWAPSPAPAIFENGEFALVPRSSCFGILEIKTSAYKPAKDLLGTSRPLQKPDAYCADVTRLDAQIDLNPGLHTASREDQSTLSVRTDLVTAPKAMAVIAAEFHDQKSHAESIRKRGDALILLRQAEENGDLVANSEDVHRLINFCVSCRFRARTMMGFDYVNIKATRLSAVRDARPVPPTVP